MTSITPEARPGSARPRSNSEGIAKEAEHPPNSIKPLIEEENGRYLSEHDRQGDPFNLLVSRSDSMDRLIGMLVDQMLASVEGRERDFGRFALLSQGGYGRRELCLHSDIDLLLIYEGRAQRLIKLFGERVLPLLWDGGLEVGFAARTPKDCIRLMEEDLTVQTSLLDARHLGGDGALSQRFSETISRHYSKEGNRRKFVEKKVRENEDRIHKYGDSVYLLEPNLKEGEGGLRDYHTILWLARVLRRISRPEDLVAKEGLSGEEFQSLWSSVQFLWRVRNELHRRSGRKNDQLLFEHQEGISQWLGFKNSPESLGVELFMQEYYRHAASIRQISQSFLRRAVRTQPKLFPAAKVPAQDPRFRVVDGRLTFGEPGLAERNPLTLLKIFQLSQGLEVELDEFAKETIRANLHRIDEAFRENPEAGSIFRQMLAHPKGLSKTLFAMNELKVLGAYLPEFSKLVFRVQHDVYHVYTVDTHSLFAVGEVEKLLAGETTRASHPTATAVVQDIRNLEVLTFGVLYHDIGKGEGSGHVEKGAPLIRRAAQRLGFSRDEVDRLEFLERSHLIMSHLAFRRDLEDPNLVIRFAREVQSVDTLNYLYVLTFCDIQGVSPDAMTDWKASLLEYLYLKAREVLRKGTSTPERIRALIPRVAADIRALLGTEVERTRGDDFLRAMPPRYILATPPEQIVRHLRLWGRLDTEPIVFEWRVLAREGLNEAILMTVESRGLFSKMAGLFAAHHINISEAQLFLTSRGQVLYLFKVGDPDGKAIDDSEKWDRVTADLKEVVQGRLPIERLVADKFRPSIMKKKTARILPSRVEIDNDISAYYSVVDVFAQDRLGLLYQITSTLEALGLYVDVSKISTKVDQVADTFYVKDIFGQKVTSKERLHKIETSLQKVLEEEPYPGWTPLKGIE